MSKYSRSLHIYYKHVYTWCIANYFQLVLMDIIEEHIKLIMVAQLEERGVDDT